MKVKLATSRLNLKSSRLGCTAIVDNSETAARSWEQRTGREQVFFRQPLMGRVEVNAKTIAEQQAIGGLRDAAKTMRQLTISAAFGRTLGDSICSALTRNTEEHRQSGTLNKSWVEQMCSMVGADTAPTAPPDAVRCVRDILVRSTGHTAKTNQAGDPFCTTDVDADLLESWRKAASDPDDAVCEWLRTGAHAGTRHHGANHFWKLFANNKVALFYCLSSNSHICVPPNET
jgi:hypothetical protein